VSEARERRLAVAVARVGGALVKARDVWRKWYYYGRGVSIDARNRVYSEPIILEITNKTWLGLRRDKSGATQTRSLFCLGTVGTPWLYPTNRNLPAVARVSWMGRRTRVSPSPRLDLNGDSFQVPLCNALSLLKITDPFIDNWRYRKFVKIDAEYRTMQHLPVIID